MSRAQLRPCSQGTLFLKDRPTRIGVGSHQRVLVVTISAFDTAAKVIDTYKSLVAAVHVSLIGG